MPTPFSPVYKSIPKPFRTSLKNKYTEDKTLMFENLANSLNNFIAQKS